jgi:hypothetical protein
MSVKPNIGLAAYSTADQANSDNYWIMQTNRQAEMVAVAAHMEDQTKWSRSEISPRGRADLLRPRQAFLHLDETPALLPS